MDNNDAVRSQLLFSASRKSVGIAYVLWFFLGMFGAHRFYLGETGTAAAQLLLTLVAIPLALVVIGWFVLLGVGIWVLVDAILIPGMAEKYNLNLAEHLSAR